MATKQDNFRFPIVWVLSVLLLVESALLLYIFSHRVTASDDSEPVSAVVTSSDIEATFRATLQENPRAIASLVPHDASLGGVWGAYFPDKIRFVPPRFAVVYYEDGHNAGVLVVEINDPARPKTWRVLYDDSGADSAAATSSPASGAPPATGPE